MTITPYHSIAARSDAPLFFFGDHASAVIPPEFDHLGLSGRDLIRHIAVDIGTAGLITKLCAQFSCGGHLAGVSRLVIDCNRESGATDLIPDVSDGTNIPGNMNLSASQMKRRVNDIYRPYHNALGSAIDDLANRVTDPLIVSIHSFTPKPDTGEKRAVQIGFIIKSDPHSADAAIREFNTISMNYDVRRNEPYSGLRLNHTVDTHVGSKGYRHLNIEVRQDLIDSESGEVHMAMILSRIIDPVMRKRPNAPL